MKFNVPQNYFGELEGHPSLGASWEGLVLEELLDRVSERELYFWSTHAGAEIDFIWRRGDQLIGFEAKWGDAPSMTKSMHIALADLKLSALYVIYPGPVRYRLDRRVEVIPIGNLPAVIAAR